MRGVRVAPGASLEFSSLSLDLDLDRASLKLDSLDEPCASLELVALDSLRSSRSFRSHRRRTRRRRRSTKRCAITATRKGRRRLVWRRALRVALRRCDALRRGTIASCTAG